MCEMALQGIDGGVGMQVQHLALGSFLGRDWNSVDYLSSVPPAFLAEALLPAACGWTTTKGGPPCQDRQTDK